MRKIAIMISFVIGFMFIPIVLIFAASVVGELVFDKEGIEVYFYSLGAIAGLVIPITQFLKNLINSSGNWTRFISWFVAFALSFFGWLFGLGMLAGLSWVWVLIYGIAAGLISNSIFDAVYVEMILKLFKDKTPR